VKLFKIEHFSLIEIPLPKPDSANYYMVKPTGPADI